jgi:hypothetical protein
MIRRTFIATAVVLAGCAAAAFGFAPDISRVARAVSAPFRGRGFTPLPAATNAHTGADSTDQELGAAAGLYCPLPTRDKPGSSTKHGEPSASLTVAGAPDLVLDGQTTPPQANQPKICVGVPPAAGAPSSTIIP